MDATYTHDVQLARFRWDQVEERGPIDVEGAIEAFRGFPFRQEQEVARSLPEPTFPTVSFRSHPDGAVLAIWSLEPGEFEVHLEADRVNVTVPERDPGQIEAAIRHFFAGERRPLLRGSAAQRQPRADSGIAGRLKSWFGRR